MNACKECKYFERDDETSRAGECHFLPPAALNVPGKMQGSIVTLGVTPPVRPGRSACREFVAKLEVLDGAAEGAR